MVSGTLALPNRVVLTSPNFLAFHGIKWGPPLLTLSITFKGFASTTQWELSGIRFRDEGNGWKYCHFHENQNGIAILFFLSITVQQGKNIKNSVLSNQKKYRCVPVGRAGAVREKMTNRVGRSCEKKIVGIKENI